MSFILTFDGCSSLKLLSVARWSENPLLPLLKELGPAEVGVFLKSKETNFVPTLKCDNGASKLLFEINSKDYWIMLLLIIIIVVVISAGVMQVWQRSCRYGYKSSTFWAIHTRDYSAWWFLLKNCSSQWKKAYLQLHIHTDPLRILNSFLVFLEILCKFSYLPTFRILILASAGISSSSSL